jgi:hypothetical protein
MLTIALEPAEVVVRRTLKAGRRWFEEIGRFLVERPDDPIALVVPSVIVPEYNVILYPRLAHFEAEFVRMESVEPFEFDPRMFEQIPTG